MIWHWLFAFAFLAQSARSPAQSPQADPAQPLPCDRHLLDTTFTFASLPEGHQTVTLHLHNIGPTSCLLHDGIGSSFAVDGHSMFVEFCWLCDSSYSRPDFPARQSGNRLVLAAGQSAAVDNIWSSTGASCQYADWANMGGTIFTPSEWPMRICSPVRSDGYRLDTEPQEVDTRLSISVLQNPVYADEYPTLRVELIGSSSAKDKANGCASLYTVRQQPKVGIRLDPVGYTAKVIPSFTPEQLLEDANRKWPSWRHPGVRNCTIKASETSADFSIRASDLAETTHLEWRTASTQPGFIIADTHFSVLDPDTLDPNWGDLTSGIRAGLSVDHPTFHAGQGVLLHLRWQNISASKNLGTGECGEPLPTIEIQDAQHHLLQTVDGSLGCMGHGWGPFTLDHGDPKRSFLDLRTPLKPGVYFLVSAWSPLVLEDAPDPNPSPRGPGPRRRLGDIYGIAHSRAVRVEIVP